MPRSPTNSAALTGHSCSSAPNGWAWIALADRQERIRRLVHAFLQSECDEAEVRTALADAAPLYRDAPEAEQARLAGSAVILELMRQALPELPLKEVERAATLVELTLTQVGSRFSEKARTQGEIRRSLPAWRTCSAPTWTIPHDHALRLAAAERSRLLLFVGVTA